MNHSTSLDTPARIAILGGGPIGLEAALYARFLGYDVDLYERGQVCENLREWNHVRLFTDAQMNISSLGQAALEAQNSDYQPPADGAMLTAEALIERYFEPLAHSDLLSASIHQHTEVLRIGREGVLKGDFVGDPRRAAAPFRILIRDPEAGEQVRTADAIIDATGTYGNHNWMGRGGVPAIGELPAHSRIQYGLPDILGREREHYAERHVLVVGSGYSAATNVCLLAELAEDVASTRVTWVTRSDDSSAGPIRRIPNDRLASRDELAVKANELAATAGGPITHFDGTWVESIVYLQEEKHTLEIEVRGRQNDTLRVDTILANVGFRPDASLYDELQVHTCQGSDGPVRLAAHLLGQTSPDCLDGEGGGTSSLITSEPHFYILGAKSYGRDSRFLLSIGRQQIRDLFSLLADRADLDLYQNFVQDAAL